jgi:hypothetical protein
MRFVTAQCGQYLAGSGRQKIASESELRVIAAASGVLAHVARRAGCTCRGVVSGAPMAEAARIGAGLAVRRRAELMRRLMACFARTDTWQQAGKYVSALVSELPRRNGWTIAEHAGDRSPDRMQRLLNRASWDTLAVMGEVWRFAACGLAEAAPRGRRRGGLVIAAIDETGQEKSGGCTAGVKRLRYRSALALAAALQAWSRHAGTPLTDLARTVIR